MFRGGGSVRREDVQREWECEKEGCSEGVGM